MIEYNQDKLIEMIKNGSIFIYPTDTIYGLGCNALNEEAVQRIKQIKARDSNKPLSVIAPSKEWIFENLQADKKIVNKYLPGKYTLILKKKNPSFLYHVSSTDCLGVRIPDHRFAKLIEKANVPFVTTSVNLSGEKPVSDLSEINHKILEKVDIVINEGKLLGKPSTIILPNRNILKR